MSQITAMILAGGRGKRMGVLCDSKPKPALPFAGKFKVIDFGLSNCLNSDIQDIGVLTGYQRSYLGNYVKRWHAINAPGKNITVLKPKNGSYLGTADAVYQNLNFLSKQGAATILVLAADHIYKMEYRKMIAFHQAVKADVTVGVISVPIEQACQFGNVQRDAESKIIDFKEKPVKPLSSLVSMGIYIFNHSALSRCLIEDAEQPDSVHDFGHVILPKLIKRDRVFAYRFDGYWQDIGTPEAYYKANLDLMSEYPAFSLDDKWPVFTLENKTIPAKMSHNSQIRNSKIGSGCVIKGRVINSVLSSGVWVGENACIKNSVIMANTSIGRHSVIMNSILDEGVNIGAQCQVGDELGKESLHSGLTVLGKNVKVPSYSHVKLNGDIIHAHKSLPEYYEGWVGENQPAAI